MSKKSVPKYKKEIELQSSCCRAMFTVSFNGVRMVKCDKCNKNCNVVEKRVEK